MRRGRTLYPQLIRHSRKGAYKLYDYIKIMLFVKMLQYKLIHSLLIKTHLDFCNNLLYNQPFKTTRLKDYNGNKPMWHWLNINDRIIFYIYF